MDENALSFEIRRAAFKVYAALGLGLLESVYELALAFKLRQVGLRGDTQVAQPVAYRGQQLDGGYRLDLLVEHKVIVELKSVEIILSVHHKQLLTYLKLSGFKLGQLINFNVNSLKYHRHRLVNGL